MTRPGSSAKTCSSLKFGLLESYEPRPVAASPTRGTAGPTESLTMQVPRDVLPNRWTWLMILTLLTLVALYQYASSRQHEGASLMADEATTAEATHVLQALQRRLSDVSQALSGTGSADDEKEFRAAALLLLRANPFLQAIIHESADGSVSRVSADPTLGATGSVRDPLSVQNGSVALSRPHAAPSGDFSYSATSADGGSGFFDLVFEAEAAFGIGSPFRDRQDIALRVWDGSDLVFASPDSVNAPSEASYGTTVETTFLGRAIRVRALPSEDLVAGTRDVWKTAAIGSMILAAASAFAIIVGFAFSIRRHRLVEESLRGSEARYRDLYEEAPVGYMSVSLDGTIIESNRRASEMFGYPLDELIGREVFELYPEDGEGRERALAVFRRFKSGEDIEDVKDADVQFCRSDGRLVWGSLSVQAIIDGDGIVVGSRSALMDITERKVAEENGRRVSHENAVLAEIGRIITSSQSIEDVYDRFAGQVRRLVPFEKIDIATADQAKGTLRVEYVAGVPAEYASGHQGFTRPLKGSILEAVMERGTGILSVPRDKGQLLEELPGAELSYQRGIASLIAVPLVGGGKCIGMLTVASPESQAYTRDDLNLVERVGAQISGAIANDRLATQRAEAEEALRVSEERFRSLFEYSAGGTGVVDRDCRFVQVNKAICDILGYSADELLGRHLSELTRADDWPETRHLLQELWAGERRSYTIEKRYIHKDGHDVWCVASISAILDAEGKAAYAVGQLQDVTELKQLETQLLQSQKMEAVGELAGGVAHDFNNLLTAIIGYTSLAKDSLPPGDRNRDHLQQVDSAAQRAATITRQLLAFSRREVSEPRVVALNDSVLSTASMLRRLIGADIELVTLPGAPLGMVRVDPGQIEQVLVAMAVNARDAMMDGGKLTIQTSNVVLGVEPAGRRVDLEPGPYVMMSIADTGEGIPPDVRPRLFEPFFTTKEVGKGTGLGLATCYGIIKQSGGDIDVRSEIGEGTTFDVYLPSLGADVPEEDAKVPKNLPRGTETVLLVEDEPAVRGLASYVLRRQGYQVLEAENGEEALRVADAHAPYEIDLLLTDVVMPRMGGKELAERLRVDMPETKVIFTSGYAENGSTTGAELDPAIPILAKPFMPEVVAVKVREVLDAPVLTS